MSFLILPPRKRVRNVVLHASILSTGGAGTNPSFTVPSSTRGGDLGFAIIRNSDSGNAPVIAAASGWTELATATASLLRGSVFYRVMQGHEGGASTGAFACTGGGSVNVRAEYLQFRPDGHVSSLSFSTPVTEATTGNPTQQTIATSAARVPVLALGIAITNVTTLVPATSGTLVSSGSTLTGVASNSMSYLAYNAGSTPADLTYDKDDDGVNVLISFYAQFNG